MRLTFAYDENGVRLVRRTLRTKDAPPADDEQQAARELAITAELRDREGRMLFRRVLTDPFPESIEFPTGDGGFRRTAAPESGVFTLVAPHDERLHEVVVLAGRGIRPGLQAFREAREQEGERTVLARVPAQAAAVAPPPPLPTPPLTTKIVDNTPSAIGFNVVVMGDGYTAAELGDFAGDADSFLNVRGGLALTAPFDRHWNDINVYRIDVESNESGADRPVTGDLVDTYFDAEYGPAGLEGLVTVNQQTVIGLADDQVPNWDALVVAVNSRDTGIQGGTGGTPVAVYTVHAGPETAVHEVGHAAFGLGDEYDYYASCELDGSQWDEYTGGEPIHPNLSATADRHAIKWADLIDPATPMPTSVNPDPTRCDERTLQEINPTLTETTVGAFDGALHYKSGVYRPAYICRMRRSSHLQFCPVCESVIESRLLAAFSAGSEDLCFVATAVYGDALHPDVVALRRWRDRHLAPGARGRTAMRLLVAVYRQVGPPLARFTRRRPGLAEAIRARLTEPLARRLR
jgi:hypothetical protein